MRIDACNRAPLAITAMIGEKGFILVSFISLYSGNREITPIKVVPWNVR